MVATRCSVTSMSTENPESESPDPLPVEEPEIAELIEDPDDGPIPYMDTEAQDDEQEVADDLLEASHADPDSEVRAVRATSRLTAKQGAAAFLRWRRNAVGMCLKETRTAYGIPSGEPDATRAWRSAIGRHAGDTTPPVGAPVFWTGGSSGHGHIAIYVGKGLVRSTDAGGRGRMGTRPLSWFASRWGLKYGGWAEGFNGHLVRDLTASAPRAKYTSDIYSNQLGYGAQGDSPSDTVRELQYRLNGISLKGGQELSITGFYNSATDDEVRKWQIQVCGDHPDPDKRSFLGPEQRRRMFPKPTYTIHDSGLPRAASDATPATVELVKRATAGLANVIFESGWDDPGRAGNGTFVPKYVIMHHTANPTSGSSLGWLSPGGAFPTVAAGNFLVDADGTIRVISGYRAYHAGAGGPYGPVPVDQMNGWSFGIEIENAGTTKDLPQVQIDAAASLAAALVREMGSPVENIINHRTWTTRKVDTLYEDGFWQDAATKEEWMTVKQGDARYAPKGGVYSRDEADAKYAAKGESYTRDEADAAFTPAGAGWARDEADARYIPMGATYSKDEADAKYAPLEEVYSRGEADSRYTPIGTTYTKLESDASYAPVGVSYTREESDSAYPAKGEVYTRGEADAQFLTLAETDARYALKATVTGLKHWYGYSGKPAGSIKVKDSDGWVKLDCYTADPPLGGLELHMLYANCVLTWDSSSGLRVGTIRVKYVRENGDATAYQDYTVTSKSADFLITAQHFETGEKGQGGRWWISCSGDLYSLTVGTRYVKSSVIGV